MLRDAIELKLPLHEAIAALSAFEWDSDKELATLARQDILSLLRRFLADELTAGELEEWADAIESREDVALETGHEDILKTFLFEASNPVLSEPLTRSWAQRWEAELHVSTD